jgi:hypothetical protein
MKFVHAPSTLTETNGAKAWATEENRNSSRTILAAQAMLNVGGWTGVDGCYR